MKIRSITYFCNPQWPLNEKVLKQAGLFITAARNAYEAAGYEVEVTRLATIPFPHLVPSVDVQQLLDLAQTLEKTAIGLGYEYVALGPAFPDTPRSYEVIPNILGATEVCFMGGLLTTPGGGVSLPAVKACAGIIHRITPLSPNGFTNLRFGAIANVLPGGPFLPAAYHVGGEARFALATESADLAVDAFTDATSLEGARQALIEAVESHARKLEKVAHDLAAFGAKFGGLDFTLAPFPEEDRSFGTAMERMGVPAVGLHGSLAAAAIITDTLDRAQYPRAGFNGLMMPVLEDTILAKRTAEGVLTVKDLLMYSAVCGTGLDTVPLPGDTSQGQLAAILLDIAALAQRLDKPLIARLMPVPGKAAGDPTDFDFPYFINGRILKVDAEPLRGLLTGDETFSLKARR